MKFIDFRSDTVTVPTEEMKKAMFEAEIGDDVYDDDPTAIKLEELSAKITGKEAGLFVPSGTFGNQLCLLTHTLRGDEVILGGNSHIMMHEVGASSVIAGVQLRNIETENGQLPIEKVKRFIREDDIHYPRTGLICMENAHGCGAVLPLENMKEIYNLAKENGVPVHLDGARVFNAAAVLGVEPKEICKYADSVTFCISKGLCAPIGSVVVGTKEFILKAKKNRKLMGGGLRQIGFIAAAGIYALENMVDNLKVDHEKSTYLAEKLSNINGITVKFNRNDINMVFFEIEDGLVEEKHLIDELYKAGFKVGGIEDGEWRFVTNYWTSKGDIDNLVDCCKKIILK
jgi:threonine aldolase